MAGDEMELHVELLEAYIAEYYGLLKRKFSGFTTSYRAFSSNYHEMIGAGNYRDGTIAQALVDAPEKLSERDLTRLTQSLGLSYTEALLLMPEEFAHLPEPSIRLVPREQSLTMWGDHTFDLPFWPGIVVEYGPGIAGLRKMTREIPATAQTVLIEKGDYKNAVL